MPRRGLAGEPHRDVRCQDTRPQVGKGADPRWDSGEHTVRSGLLYCCCLVAQSCPTLATPWTIARQAPLSTGFSRPEYWSGLPFPSPGDLSNPGIVPAFPVLAGGFFTNEPPGKPCNSSQMSEAGSLFNPALSVPFIKLG